jgi:hypothetical protein
MMLAEMAATRAAVRRRAEEEEERLWSRADLLVEVETLHLINWKPRRVTWSDRVHRPLPALGGSNLSVSVEKAPGRMLRSAIARANQCVPDGKLRVAPPPEAPAETDTTPVDPMSAASRADQTPPQQMFVGSNASWTPERICKLRQLWLEGMPAEEIASRLGGVTRNRVVGKAYRIGLPKRESAAAAELRAMANAPCEEARAAPQPEPESPWSMEKVELLETLWRRGLSASMIANLIGGTSRNAVIGKAKRLGLPMREHPLTPAAGSDHQGIA